MWLHSPLLSFPLLEMRHMQKVMNRKNPNHSASLCDLCLSYCTSLCQHDLIHLFFHFLYLKCALCRRWWTERKQITQHRSVIYVLASAHHLANVTSLTSSGISPLNHGINRTIAHPCSVIYDLAMAHRSVLVSPGTLLIRHYLSIASKSDFY